MAVRFGVIYVPPPRGAACHAPQRGRGVHSLHEEGEAMVVDSRSHVTWWPPATADGVNALVCSDGGG
jgi:hypothetical protein